MNEKQTKQNNRLGDYDTTLDIMLFGQPDIKSARIVNALKRRRRKKTNRAK